MTKEQLLAQLAQEYAHRREENLRAFQARQAEACARCPGLEALLGARHAAVMQGVRQSLLSAQKAEGKAAALPAQMAEWNRQIAQKLKDGGFAPDFLQPVYTCPICRDEGYVYAPSRRMCRCMQDELNRRLLRENGLGANSGTFETFDLSIFPDEPDDRGVSQRALMEINRGLCERYADQYPQNDPRDLLLMGKSGLGKTFLLQCMANRLTQRGYPPTYVSAYRLFETARQSYMENDSAILAPLMDAPMLIVDDLGTEPLMNNVTVTQLFNLLNERQLNSRHTVLSTNLTMPELRDRYTERVASRLLDATQCLRIGFVGADVRRSLKRKAEQA